MIAILALLRRVPLWVWLALAALAVIGWQHVEITHYRSRAAAMLAQSRAYADTQRSQLATIATLQAANRQWASKYAADMAVGKSYTDAAMQYAKQMQDAAHASAQKLRVIYDNVPSARAWAAASPPADVVRQLRDNASGPQ